MISLLLQNKNNEQGGFLLLKFYVDEKDTEVDKNLIMILVEMDVSEWKKHGPMHRF